MLFSLPSMLPASPPVARFENPGQKQQTGPQAGGVSAGKQRDNGAAAPGSSLSITQAA